MKITGRINSVSGLQLFQVIRFAGFFITGIALARLGVSISTIGNYEKLMLIAGATSFFWVQGILNSMLASYDENRFNRSFLFNVFVLLSLTAILVYSLMRIFSGVIINLFSDGFLPGYRLICLYILFNTPCYLIEYIYLLKKEPRPLVTYGFISAIVSIAAVVIPLAAGYSVETGLACLVLWAVCRFLWLLRLIIRNSSPVLNVTLIKSSMLLAAPLVLSYLIAGSTDYIDGLMVTRYYGDESFAVFRYGAKELPLSLLLSNALSTSMIVLISASPVTALFDLKRQSEKLMHILFPLSIILLVSSYWLYPLVFDNRFAGSARFFNIYLLLVISRTLFPHPVAFAKKENKVAFYISTFEVLINITASYILMHYYGMAGIAMGTVLAHYIEKFIMCIFIYKKYKIPFKSYVPVRTWLFYTVCISLVYIFITLLH